MLASPTIEANGASIPAIGLGTWQAVDDDGTQAVLWALEAGYRHIDTAARYGNEPAIGAALRISGLRRDEYFVTTKVWHEDVACGRLQQSAEASLARLGLDCVDLFLIHWPNPSVPLAETMRALCEVRRHGLARHIGVANFPVALLHQAVALSTEPLVANQCEYHPYLDQAKVMSACRRYGMAFISYSPIGSGSLLREPLLSEIAGSYGRTPAQIVLRWHMQQGIAAIPKSANRRRIAENLAVFDFRLTAADMSAISALARPDGRVFSPAWAPEWDT